MIIHTMDTIIGPIGYAQRPEDIRQAFAEGCGSVIVDGRVPPDVKAELDVIAMSLATHLPLLSNSAWMSYRNNSSMKLRWFSSKGPVVLREYYQQMLPLTEAWLSEQVSHDLESGLSRTFSRVAHNDRLLSVWLMNAMLTGWHTDDSEKPVYDIHYHIYGEGLAIAAPTEPMRVQVDSKRIYFGDLPGIRIDTYKQIQDIDDLLIEQGFKIISLQPGQKIIFRNNCMHRSAPHDEEQFKMRAAMF